MKMQIFKYFYDESMYDETLYYKKKCTMDKTKYCIIFIYYLKRFLPNEQLVYYLQMIEFLDRNMIIY
jgi:hypothetical protein